MQYILYINNVPFPTTPINLCCHSHLRSILVFLFSRLYYVLFYFFFNWSIVNLKYCASIHCTGDYRGWDGWMVSLTQWTWVWVDWGSWWWTGRPGVLWFMGSRRVRHDWVTELNWTEDQLHLMWLLS